LDKGTHDQWLGGPLFPPRQQVFNAVQRGTRTAAGRRRGQAYNLTAEEAKTSEEVITCKITMHSKLVLTLLDSGASHCYISNRFTALHSIPMLSLDHQWEISVGNGVVISNRICIDYAVELCNRTLAIDMLVLDTRRHDVILGMTWLSKYHAVINCQNKKNLFSRFHIKLSFSLTENISLPRERHR